MGNKLWKVVCEYKDDWESNFTHVFKTKHEAKYFYIDLINKHIEGNIIKYDNREMEEDDYITTEDEADEWLELKPYNNIYYSSFEIETFKIPEYLKLIIDSKKYNL